jgi:hypothetical protein
MIFTVMFLKILFLAMLKVNKLMDNINVTVNELQDLGNTLRYQLDETRHNLTDIRSACYRDPGASAKGICGNITHEYMLAPEADYTKVGH